MEDRTHRIEHPAHYNSEGIEAIDLIEAFHLDFCLGNVVKYVTRSGRKSSASMSIEQKSLEDLKKAKWYLERELSCLEKKLNSSNRR